MVHLNETGTSWIRTNGEKVVAADRQKKMHFPFSPDKIFISLPVDIKVALHAMCQTCTTVQEKFSHLCITYESTLQEVSKLIPASSLFIVCQLWWQDKMNKPSFTAHHARHFTSLSIPHMGPLRPVNYIENKIENVWVGWIFFFMVCSCLSQGEDEGEVSGLDSFESCMALQRYRE